MYRLDRVFRLCIALCYLCVATYSQCQPDLQYVEADLPEFPYAWECTSDLSCDTDLVISQTVPACREIRFKFNMWPTDTFTLFHINASLALDGTTGGVKMSVLANTSTDNYKEMIVGHDVEARNRLNQIVPLQTLTIYKSILDKGGYSCGATTYYNESGDFWVLDESECFFYLSIRNENSFNSAQVTIGGYVGFVMDFDTIYFDNVDVRQAKFYGVEVDESDLDVLFTMTPLPEYSYYDEMDADMYLYQEHAPNKYVFPNSVESQQRGNHAESTLIFKDDQGFYRDGLYIMQITSSSNIVPYVEYQILAERAYNDYYGSLSLYTIVASLVVMILCVMVVVGAMARRRREQIMMAQMPVGATEEIIHKLKEVIFHTGDMPTEDANCCICLMDYDDGENLRELPCGHPFHQECIDEWLIKNKKCPLCQQDIEAAERWVKKPDNAGSAASPVTGDATGNDDGDGDKDGEPRGVRRRSERRKTIATKFKGIRTVVDVKSAFSKPSAADGDSSSGSSSDSDSNSSDDVPTVSIPAPDNDAFRTPSISLSDHDRGNMANGFTLSTEKKLANTNSFQQSVVVDSSDSDDTKISVVSSALPTSTSRIGQQKYVADDIGLGDTDDDRLYHPDANAKPPPRYTPSKVPDLSKNQQPGLFNLADGSGSDWSDSDVQHSGRPPPTYQ